MSKKQPKQQSQDEKPVNRIAIGDSRFPKKKQSDIFARLILPPHPFEDLPAREEVPKVLPFGYPNEIDVAIQTGDSANDADCHTVENLQNVAIQADENVASKIATNAQWLANGTDAVASKIATDKNAASHKSQKPRDWKKVAANRKKASVFVRPNEEIANKFKKFCIDQNWDVSYGTELAWQYLIANAASHIEQDVAIKLAHDDRRLMKMWKTKPAIINHYLRYNEKNRWTIKI